MIEKRPLIDTATNIVVNVVKFDTESDWTPPDGHTLGPVGGWTGDTWTGSEYVKPVEQVPPASKYDVNAERDRRIIAGFSIDFGGGVIRPFDSDPSAQKRISAVHSFALAAIMAGAQPNDLRWANPDADFAWICKDNTTIQMDAHTAREFAEAAMGYESALVTTARLMKDSGAIPEDYANDQYWPSSTLTLG